VDPLLPYIMPQTFWVYSQLPARAPDDQTHANALFSTLDRLPRPPRALVDPLDRAGVRVSRAAPVLAQLDPWLAVSMVRMQHRWNWKSGGDDAQQLVHAIDELHPGHPAGDVAQALSLDRMPFGPDKRDALVEFVDRVDDPVLIEQVGHALLIQAWPRAPSRASAAALKRIAADHPHPLARLGALQQLLIHGGPVADLDPSTAEAAGAAFRDLSDVCSQQPDKSFECSSWLRQASKTIDQLVDHGHLPLETDEDLLRATVRGCVREGSWPESPIYLRCRVSQGRWVVDSSSEGFGELEACIEATSVGGVDEGDGFLVDLSIDRTLLTQTMERRHE
jgi:hypothetical protein